MVSSLPRLAGSRLNRASCQSPTASKYRPTAHRATPAITHPAPFTGSGLAITTTVNGVIKQESNTSQLVFDALDVVADLSRIMTLDPGDVIATGTPGGVGVARNPPEFLEPGDEVEVAIEGLGRLVNRCV